MDGYSLSNIICPNIDRTLLLADTTDDLSEWLNQDYLTNLELATGYYLCTF